MTLLVTTYPAPTTERLLSGFENKNPRRGVKRFARGYDQSGPDIIPRRWGGGIELDSMGGPDHGSNFTTANGAPAPMFAITCSQQNKEETWNNTPPKNGLNRGGKKKGVFTPRQVGIKGGGEVPTRKGRGFFAKRSRGHSTKTWTRSFQPGKWLSFQSGSLFPPRNQGSPPVLWQGREKNPPSGKKWGAGNWAKS